MRANYGLEDWAARRGLTFIGLRLSLGLGVTNGFHSGRSVLLAVGISRTLVLFCQTLDTEKRAHKTARRALAFQDRPLVRRLSDWSHPIRCAGFTGRSCIGAGPRASTTVVVSLSP